MGTFKQLLPISGKTFVEACVDNLLASRVAEVIVVTGYNEAGVRAALGNRPVRIVNNPEYESGMGSSVISGVKSVTIINGGILIALADQPLIGPDVLNQIISGYEVNAPTILIPTYQGKKGHPIILNATLKQEIVSMDPAIGLKQITQAHADHITYIEVGSDSVLVDFDLPGDLDQLPDGIDQSA